MAERVVAKYTSESGEHFMGVPARDLYESDWNRLSDEQKADVIESPFYTVRGAASQAPKAALVGEDAPKAEPAKAEAKK